MKAIKLFLLALLVTTVFVSGCKKDTGADPEESSSTTVTTKHNNVDTTLYFKGTINGAEVKIYPDTIYTNAIGDLANKKIPAGYEYAPYSYIVKSTAQTNATPANVANSGGIAFILDTAQIKTNTVYRNIIRLKSYSFGQLSDTTMTNGVSGAYVYYYDNAGTLWTSGFGTADQTGSTFTVTSYSDIPGAITAPFKKIKASFSCKLYDGKGNSKTLTNGTFSGKIITW